MSLKEDELITMITAHLQKKKEEVLREKIEMKRQEVIQFVASKFIDDYVTTNMPTSEQGLFRRGLINTLIANDFELWNKYATPN